MVIRISLSLLLFFAASLHAQPPTGDQLWLLRAEGAQGETAAAEPIDAAINAYGTRLRLHPDDLETRWKLIRALRFKGAYVADDGDQKRTILDQARQVGQAGIQQLDAVLASKKAGSVMKGDEKKIAEILREVPHAGEFLYWDAVAWGEWALAFGKLAAVRQGAADRILRGATLAMLIDPSIERGGGARVLGRLHHQTPRVPFVTGWASDRKAVRYLRESLAQGPDDKLTKVFLAEALVSENSSSRPEAVRLLRSVISAPIDPAWSVEEADARAQAQALLTQWGEN